MEVVTVAEVAKRLGKSQQYIRVCLQKGLLPFVLACKMLYSSTYSYVIFPAKFKEYVGEK